MIFVKAKIGQAHLLSLFLLVIISLTRAYGQESATASFSMESNVLTVPVLEVTAVGQYMVQLNLVENSRFKLTVADQADWATTDNFYHTATSTMILPKVAVLQGGVEIARYELHLLLEDSESLLFAVDYVNKLSLPSSSSREEISREEICSDYGCFELHTKLVGHDDGEIRPGGISLKALSWGRDELKSISARQSLPLFSNIERVGQMAAPSAVVVYGDFCMDQSLNSPIRSNPVLQATNHGTGFFVSDSLVLTTTKVLLTFEDGALGGPVEIPSSAGKAQDCETYGEQLSKSDPDGQYILESGAGPIIQLFDGRWALGEVVWADDATGLGALRLVAVTDDRTRPFASWAPWDGPVDNQHWLSLRAADVYQIGETATLHNPDKGRYEGGWFVSPDSAMTCSINATSQRLYLSHYSDPGSNGAPIVDNTGVVIAIVEDQSNDSAGVLCPANKTTTTKNSLGPLPRYYADSTNLTVGAPITSELIDALRIIDPSINSNPAPRSEELPIRPAVSLEDFQRFEVLLMGDEFTESGFPVSELNSTAIDIAKQATLAFIRETGCTTCDVDRLNLDFSVPCICTGFAVTEHLIVTNDHCVSALSIGAKTTFRSFYGQDVEAELVGKSSLDGEAEMNLRHSEIFGNPKGEEVPTGGRRGDVALLRTSQAMKLVPLNIANSSALEPWQPLITVGHPSSMARTGPWVTGVGSFLGASYFTRTVQAYNLPAQSGASGSAVVNLKGELVGQIAYGGIASQFETMAVLPQKYNLFAVELKVDVLESTPAPYSRYPGIPISSQLSSGAPSNYIKEMIDKWAPGELP